MNSATIAAAIRDRIEALVPADQSSADDVFRVIVGLDTQQQGSRLGYLTPTGGTRVTGKVNRCNTWSSTFELVMYYVGIPTEAGQTGTLEMRFADLSRDADLLPLVRTAAERLLRECPGQVEPLLARWMAGRERYAEA